MKFHKMVWIESAALVIAIHLLSLGHDLVAARILVEKKEQDTHNRYAE